MDTPIKYLINEILTNWKLEKVYEQNHDSDIHLNVCAKTKRFFKYVGRNIECYKPEQFSDRLEPLPNEKPYIRAELIWNDWDFELDLTTLGVLRVADRHDWYGTFTHIYNSREYLFLNTYDGGLDSHVRDSDLDNGFVVREGNKPLFWAISMDGKGIVEMATFEFTPDYAIQLGWHLISEPLHPNTTSANEIFKHYGYKRAAYFDPVTNSVSLRYAEFDENGCLIIPIESRIDVKLNPVAMSNEELDWTDDDIDMHQYWIDNETEKPPRWRSLAEEDPLVGAHIILAMPEEYPMCTYCYVADKVVLESLKADYNVFMYCGELAFTEEEPR
jgi:hypothetical protein